MTILAVDTGTTGTKMGVFRDNGETVDIIRQFSLEYPINTYNNGLFSDIEQEKWQKAFIAGCKEMNDLMGDVDIIAISGTSGLEAVLSGIMVILLGNEGIIWHCIDDVIKCTDWTRLHEILKTAGQYKANDQSLAAYLQAVHDNTFGMEASYTWEGPYDLSHEGYRKAVGVIAEQLMRTFKEEASSTRLKT